MTMTAVIKSVPVTSTVGANACVVRFTWRRCRPPFAETPQLIALYQRLRAAGKEHKRALIACARKLLIFVNTVVARGTPWQGEPPAARTANPSTA